MRIEWTSNPAPSRAQRGEMWSRAVTIVMLLPCVMLTITSPAFANFGGDGDGAPRVRRKVLPANQPSVVADHQPVASPESPPSNLPTPPALPSFSPTGTQQLDSSKLPALPTLPNPMYTTNVVGAPRETPAPPLPQFPQRSAETQQPQAAGTQPVAAGTQPVVAGTQPVVRRQPSVPGQMAALPPAPSMSDAPVRVQTSGIKPVEQQLRLTTTPSSMPKVSLSSTANGNKRPDHLENSPGSLREGKRIITRSPRVEVTLDGPQDVAVGVPQQYKVVAFNSESLSLTGLVLQVEVPSGAKVTPLNPTHGIYETEPMANGGTLVIWSIESLNPNEVGQLPLEVVASTPSDFHMTVEWTFQPFVGTTPIRVLAPKLELVLDGPREAVYGQPCAYRLTLKNSGSADAHDVSVKLSAQQYGSNATIIKRIAAGSQESMDVDLVFNQPGTITLSAESTAPNNLMAASQVEIQVRQAQLDVSIESPEFAYHGTPVPYVIRVKNNGDAPAHAVRASVAIPPNAKLVETSEAAQPQDNSVVWIVPELPPGAETELSLQFALFQEGLNEVTVQCTTSTGASLEHASTVEVQTVTDLKLLVNEPVAPAPVGGDVEYELILINQGSRTAENVNVVAMFSKDIEPVRAAGHASNLFPGQVQFDPIACLQPGESIKLKVFAVASEPGMHRFRAEVHTANSEIKLIQEETTQYMQSNRRTASSGGSLVR